MELLYFPPRRPPLPTANFSLHAPARFGRGSSGGFMRLLKLSLFRHLLATAILTLILGFAARAQTDPLQAQGVTPWGSYQHSDIDSVNMMNGSLTIRIPLYSLPQRGQLSLSFSLSHSNVFNIETVGPSTYYIAGRSDGNSYVPIGPKLVLDQVLYPTSTQYKAKSP